MIRKLKEPEVQEKILIVDSEPDMLAQLSRYIGETTAYGAVATNNPFEAAELAREKNIRLVITSLKMPGLDGIGLLSLIKDYRREMPVLVLDRFPSPQAAEDVRKKGGFDYIALPVRKERLLFAVEKAMLVDSLKKENCGLRMKLSIANAEEAALSPLSLS